MNTVVAIAKTILKHTYNFRFFSSPVDSVVIDMIPTMHEGEEYIGVYENNVGCFDDAIVISDIGLHAYIENQWVFIAYNDITCMNVDEEKTIASHITINVNDDPVRLLINGNRGQFRDVWTFLRFLMRTVTLVNKVKVQTERFKVN